MEGLLGRVFAASLVGANRSLEVSEAIQHLIGLRLLVEAVHGRDTLSARPLVQSELMPRWWTSLVENGGIGWLVSVVGS